MAQQSQGASSETPSQHQPAYLRGPDDPSNRGEEWNRTTLGGALDRCVSLGGEGDLLVFPARRLRAFDFRAEVNRFARGLLHLGVAAGEHVAVWLPNLPEYAIAELAIAKLGATMVPVNTRYKATEIEYVLRQSDATTLILIPQFLQFDYWEIFRRICPEFATGASGSHASSSLPRLQRVITLGEVEPGLPSYEQVLQLGDRPELKAALAKRESAVRADGIVILQYTSGTTAFPKAVMLTHGQILRNAHHMAQRAGIGPEDRVLSAMPRFHVGGSVCALLGSIVTGYALYMSPTFDAAETLRLIEEEQITTYIGLESMFIAIRNHEDFPRRSRQSLAKGWSAGTASILRMVAEEIGIRNICPLYGLSESSPNVCITDWRDSYEKRIHTMGRPQPGIEVKIIDPTTGTILARGERGEICVRGWSVTQGYYNQPEETARTIDADRWLHTGDLGWIDQEGYLTWTGRVKDMLRVGGENVSALEVENVLCSHPKIRAAAVVGVPDEKLREVGLAFVQLKPGTEAMEEEIIEYCRERMAGFKMPRYIRFVQRFEMTGSGKIQKFLMREKVLAELDRKQK